jgi:hypothetical protein
MLGKPMRATIGGGNALRIVPVRSVGQQRGSRIMVAAQSRRKSMHDTK